MECAGQSLPELTTELVSAYSTQSSELLVREECLQRLECELALHQVQLQTLSSEVSSSVRTICLREDSLAELSKECEEMQGEVSTLVLDRQTLQLSLQHVKKERELENKTRACYESKIQSHEAKTKQVECHSTTQVELEALREKIRVLKAKRGVCVSEFGMKQVLSGEKQQSLQDQLAALEASRQALRQNNTFLEGKITAGQETIMSLRKEVDTSRKKQAAQLKCLQRSVNESQAHKRQWIKKAEILRASISQMKQRIEE